MKIAIITPVYQGPLWDLERCLASVKAQTHSAMHLLVVDGGEGLRSDNFPGVEIIQLPVSHADAGLAARVIGLVSAIARGFDAVVFLDADRSLEPNHLQMLVDLHQETGATVCSSNGKLLDLDGQIVKESTNADADFPIDGSGLLLSQNTFATLAAFFLAPRSTGATVARNLQQAITDAELSWARQPLPPVCHRPASRAPTERIAGAEVRELSLNNALSPQGGKAAKDDTVAGKEAEAIMPVSRRENRLPQVSLCMIVKREDEPNLVSCLTSIAELFHEIIIIVDPGHSDHTDHIATAFAAKIVPFEWVNSFAAARNESLLHVTSEWVFSLDADERIDGVNQRKLRAILEQLADNNDAYFLSVWSAPDGVLRCPVVVDCVRLFRRHPSHRWQYRVHEQILPALQANKARFVWSEVIIHHFGYMTAEIRSRKRDRNLGLLRMELSEHSGDAYVLFNLGSGLFDGGRTEDALATLKRCLDKAPSDAAYLPKTYVLVARCCQLLGHNVEALRYCREGKGRFPDDLELWFEEGGLLLARGELADAKRTYKKLLKMRHKRSYVGVNTDLIWQARHNFAFVFRALGALREAEYHWLAVLNEAPEFGPAWLGLTELYLSQNRRIDIDGLVKRLETTSHTARILPGLRARLALKKSDWSYSQQILEDAIQRFPSEIWLRLLLSDILAQVAKDANLAGHHLRQILLLDPNHAVARSKLRK